VSEVAELLLAGDSERARTIARQKYPFEPIPDKEQLQTDLGLVRSRDRAKAGTAERKSISDRRRQAIWNRDGFRDRYTGAKLVHPAAT
jgi:hypothetical protein